MDKLRARLSFSEGWLPLLLGIVCLLAFGLLIPSLGFLLGRLVDAVHCRCCPQSAGAVLFPPTGHCMPSPMCSR